jgi:hypothetical protein
MTYRRYSVSRRDKQPLLDFILSALDLCGCTILYHSQAAEAPLRMTFEAPTGERIGIIAYAFFANSKITRNRPTDEHRFQVKYGRNDGELHTIWQDPFELYTTLFFGINPDRGFFVGADPCLHNPTRFFISIELKEHHVEKIQRNGWTWWERERRPGRRLDEPIEVLVGGSPENFLNFVRFERAAKGLDQGHRALLADKMTELTTFIQSQSSAPREQEPSAEVTHNLSEEFQLSHGEILDLIQSAPRLKMAVRGWVAETHLHRHLLALPEISECQRIEEDGKPDFMLRFQDSRPITLECKNVLRKLRTDGIPRVDFQKTRASKADPCSRYYRPEEFDVVAACLHPSTEQWEFAFALTRELAPHPKCEGRLSNIVCINGRWSRDPLAVLAKAV